MHQDIIQNFLTLPEVIGVALMQGRVIPYFFVKDQVVSPERKIELVRQIRKSALESSQFSDFTQFRIDEYIASTYRLNNFISLLVISNKESISVESIAKKILQSSLKDDIDATLKIFESLTKKTYQPSLNSLPPPKQTSKVEARLPESEEIPSSVEDLVNALNMLSQIVCTYLGEKITANFWQITRPNREWLNKFIIKSSATIEFIDHEQTTVSPLQHLFIREWTNSFINQCSQIIRDLPTKIDNKIQNKSYRKMISVVPSGYLSDLNSLSSEDESLFED
jgi:hypothetical protein